MGKGLKVNVSWYLCSGSLRSALQGTDIPGIFTWDANHVTLLIGRRCYWRITPKNITPYKP